MFLPAAPAPAWVSPFLDELERFQGGDEQNDQVDAFAWLVRQCTRVTGEQSNREAEEVAERVRLEDRHEHRGQDRRPWRR